MDCLNLLLIFVISAAAVTGFQLNSNPDGPKSDDLINTETRKLSRYRRGIDDELVNNAETCCNAPKSPTNDDTKKKECMQEVSSKFSVRATEEFMFSHKDSNETACFADCLLRKNNALDNGGQVILQAAIDSLAQCPGFKDQGLIDKVAIICANSPEANGGAPGENYVCNTAALRFLRCAHDIKILACPAEYQIQSEKCTKVWEQVNAKKQ